MNYVVALQQLFKDTDISFFERMFRVESKFIVNVDFLPTYDEICAVIKQFPARDEIRIIFKDDGDEICRFDSSVTLDKVTYEVFCLNAKLGETVQVDIIIDKKIKDGKFSIYNFESFANDILSLSTKEVLAAFSKLLQKQEQLYCEVFTPNCLFKTRTICFASSPNNIILQPFNREKQLNKCRENTYFYNHLDYLVLPDDFKIELDYVGNPLTELFNKIATLLSLIYISSSAVIDNNAVKIQIYGQRNLDFCYLCESIKSNEELYKIYHWIYTDGNSIDKAALAHNIISLHCRYSEIIELDGKTFSSIQSNYNLYLMENVEQYLEIKNKLAEFISNTVSKIGDYTFELLEKFKTNLLAIFAFLLTVVLSNIAAEQPLQNIFTKDITFILELILAGSLIYLIVCILEIMNKKKKTNNSYDALKKIYEDIFSKEDLELMFENDKHINSVNQAVNKSVRNWTIVWIIALLIILFAVESQSESPILRPILESICLKIGT